MNSITSVHLGKTAHNPATSMYDHFPVKPMWLTSALCAWLARTHTYLVQGKASWGTFIPRERRFREIKNFAQGNTANKRAETRLKFKLPRFSLCSFCFITQELQPRVLSFSFFKLHIYKKNHRSHSENRKYGVTVTSLGKITLST